MPARIPVTIDDDITHLPGFQVIPLYAALPFVCGRIIEIQKLTVRAPMHKLEWDRIVVVGEFLLLWVRELINHLFLTGLGIDTPPPLLRSG